MEGIFFQIIKQAFQLTKKNKVFWVVGLFLFWPMLIQSVLLLSYILPSDYQTSSGKEIFKPMEFNFIPGPITGFISLAILLFLVWSYFRARSVLISAVDKIQKKEQIKTKKIFAAAFKPSFTVMRVSLSLLMTILFLTLFLTYPVMNLMENNFSGRAYSLGLFAILIYIPIFIFLFFSIVLSPIFIILYQFSVHDSLRASFDVIRKFWPILLAFTLSLVALGFVALFFAVFLLILSALPFVLLIYIFYDMFAPSVLLSLQILAGIAGMMGYITVHVFYSSFQNIAWVLMFKEMVKPIKTEEEEKVAVPEGA